MLSNKTKIGIKRLYFLILLFIFSFPSFAFAFTWQDVENAYNSCLVSKGESDACWIEEVTTNNSAGYKVWERKDVSTVKSRELYGWLGEVHTINIQCYGQWCYGQDPISFPGNNNIFGATPPGKYKCDYTGATPGLIPENYLDWKGSVTAYAPRQNVKTIYYCDGSSKDEITPYSFSYGGYYYMSTSPCYYGKATVSNCKSKDVLKAAFIPTDKCLNKLTNTYEPCAQNCKDPVNKTNAVETCGDGIDNNCNGEIDEGCKTGIELPMTVYQCADGVGTKTYDTTSQNICTSGCALASATMVLNYYLNQSGLPMIDVLSLNEWLNKNNGYADKPETPQFDGLVDWFVISLYPNSPIRYDDIKSSEIFDIDTKTALLNSQLMDGYPIILKVKTSKGTTHFVVATGINGNTWDIIDPGHQDAKTTLAERYNNTFYGIRVYKPRQ